MDTMLMVSCIHLNLGNLKGSCQKYQIHPKKNMNELVDKLFSRLIVIIGSYKVLIKLQRDHFLEVILISELEESI